jgi:hypothetical protein
MNDGSKLYDNVPALLNQLLATTPSTARPSTRSWVNNFILGAVVDVSLVIRCYACQTVWIVIESR